MWQIIYHDQVKGKECTIWIKDENDAYRIAEMYGDDLREMKYVDSLKDYNLPDLNLS